MSFTFVDLFAGIGGFHAALAAGGGKCLTAVEIDPLAAAVYRNNWGLDPLGDITLLANEHGVSIPEHDVLCAGFPCQPFSKMGPSPTVEHVVCQRVQLNELRDMWEPDSMRAETCPSNGRRTRGQAVARCVRYRVRSALER